MILSEIKQYALNTADLVGIAPAYRMADAPDGFKPADLLSDAQVVIVVGFSLIDTTVENLPFSRSDYSHWVDVINTVGDGLIYRISSFLQQADYKAVPIPNSLPYDRSRLCGKLSLKRAAVAAGLGNFGLNNLVLTPQFGANVRFGAVITNAKLPTDPECEIDLCSEFLPVCNRACIKLCPAKAIPDSLSINNLSLKNGTLIDKQACKRYQENLTSKFQEDKILLRCGMCVANCPAGNFKRKS